jgi:hypothetical protein
MKNKISILLIIKASLVTGSLDILLACANAWWSAGVSPERVLKFVASGLIGKNAFQDVPAFAFLGLFIHYCIAFFWTILFFLLYPKLKHIIRDKYLQGILYGIFIWLAMNLLVLPISGTPELTFHWLDALKGTGILIIAIGLPLAFIAEKYYRNNIHR